jgi:SWI/SNF-related matrix-associated actin-dependent regulator 1 of chromatin subfamily A
MIRRLLKDVLKDLPDKTRTTIPITLPKSNMSEYAQMNVAFEEWMLKNHPEKEVSSAAIILTKLGYMKRKVAEWKLPFVFDWIDNFLEDTDGKLIVFGLHHKILNAIMSRYQKGSTRYPFAVKIDGTVSMIDRQRAVDSFQTRPEVRLFVGQMRASGVGLTLTASHNVLFAECDFVPSVHSQAEARARRIGQKNHVQCTYIIANSTIEEHVAEILYRKQQEFDAVVDGGRNVDSFNIIQELLRKMRKPFV